MLRKSDDRGAFGDRCPPRESPRSSVTVIPRQIPGSVSASGSHRCSASRAARPTRIQVKTILPDQRQDQHESRANDITVGETESANSTRWLTVCQAITLQDAPTASSTSGYRQPIRSPQVRQRPRKAIQLNSGMFSHHASVRVQLRQWERGLTMLSPAGQRVTQTLRKLPKASPASAANTVAKMGIM